MKRLKSILTAGLSVFVFAVGALHTVPASAQSSAALSIVPKKSYVIDAGKSVKDTLTIHNLDSVNPLNLTLRVVDFTYNDDGGTPKLMLAKDAPQTTWSLKPYLSVPTTATIAPNSSKSINLGVSIPAKVGAGSYYSAILYSSGAPDGGNVDLSASGVSLVFVSVPGTVNENLTVQKFGAYIPPAGEKKGGYVFVSATKPQSIAYTLKNEGNVTEAPAGSITLKNIFGQQQTIGQVNPNSSLALIDQTRTFIACIKLQDQAVAFNGGTAKSTACAEPDLWPGYYNASLDLFYGQNGNNTKEITSSASFWYLPWWFVIAFTVVVLLIAYFVWRIVRKIQGHKYASQRKKLSRRRK